MDSWPDYKALGPEIEPLEQATAPLQSETWDQFLARDLTPGETEQVRALLAPYLADSRLVPDQNPKTNLERLALEIWWSKRY